MNAERLQYAAQQVAEKVTDGDPGHVALVILFDRDHNMVGLGCAPRVDYATSAALLRQLAGRLEEGDFAVTHEEGRAS